MPVICAAGNVRAVAGAEFLDRLPLNLQTSAPCFTEDELPGRVHVPGRVARARLEYAAPDGVAGRIKRRGIPSEIRSGPEHAELRSGWICGRGRRLLGGHGRERDKR